MRLLIFLVLVGCTNTYVIETDNVESIRNYFRVIVPLGYLLEKPTAKDYKICKDNFDSEPIFYVRRKDRVFGRTRCMRKDVPSIKKANEICKFLGKDWKLLSFVDGKITCEEIKPD